MSLNSLMGGNKKITSIHINKIRLNKLNDYDLKIIDALAKSIAKQGQLENGLAYADAKGDGKDYTLIGGHQRYLAINSLYEKNEHDGLMLVRIIDKPASEIEEKMAIIQDNMQRKKSTKERLKEVENALEYYESIKGTDEAPKFDKEYKLRDWVGEQIGITGRQVQKYFNKLNGNDAEKTAKKESSEHKYVRNLFEDKLRTRVKVDNKKITIYYSDTNEINRILETLDLIEEK